MVEEVQTKDITIQLMIKSLTIPVTEQMPVKIVWTRGAKKAETKKRLLSDTAQTTVFDEKFEVSTQMEVDSNGRATRSKMVRIFFSLMLLQTQLSAVCSLNWWC